MRHLSWLGAGMAWAALISLGWTGSASAAKTASTSHSVSEPASAPGGETYLRQMCADLAQLKSFQVQLHSAMKVTAQGVNQSQAADFDGAMQRPNRFAMILKGSEIGLTTCCDGKKTWVYFPHMKQYIETEAPKTLNRNYLQNFLQQNPLLNISPAYGMFATFWLDDPYSLMMDGVAKTEDLGQETLDGVAARHIRLIQDKYDWDLWIAQKTPHLPMKIAMDLSKTVPPQMASRNIHLTFDMAFSHWEPNATIPAETFRFTPPASAQKVSSFLSGGEEKPQPSPLLGKMAPDINLDLLGGGKLSLAAHKGKDAVILDFWATWCPPCRAGLPKVAQVAAEYKNKGVVFYAVDLQEDAPAIKKFLGEQHLSINVALDKEGQAGTAYDAEAIPETVLIDKDGTVQMVSVGLAPDGEETLKKDLDAVLQGKKPAKEALVQASTSSSAPQTQPQTRGQ